MEGNEGTMPYRIMVQSDGARVGLQMSCQLDVAEGVLARALAHVQREILIARLVQHMALVEEGKPRIHLPSGPMI